MILHYFLITSRVCLAVVCGADRVVDNSSYCKVMQCETSCLRSIVQYENSSDWILLQIVVQCENSSDPISDFKKRGVWTRHNTISFTKEILLNIWQNTPQNLLPVFDYYDVLVDIVIGGAAVFRCFRIHRQGKWARVLVKLRERKFWMPMPSIYLANLRSLPNKTDEPLLLSRTNKDFSNSAALCFTETWPNDAIPDSALHLLNFQLFRSDRDAE